MTTIAYKGGILASDTQLTSGYDYVMGQTKKIFKVSNTCIIGSSGDADDSQLVEIFKDVNDPDERPDFSPLVENRTNIDALVIFNSDDNIRVFFLTVGAEEDQDEQRWYSHMVEICGDDPIAAVGTGAKYALGAMMTGASAEAAIRAACKLDIYSSEPIKTIPIRQ